MFPGGTFSAPPGRSWRQLGMPSERRTQMDQFPPPNIFSSYVPDQGHFVHLYKTQANQNVDPTVRNFLEQIQQEVRQIRSNQQSAAQQQQQQQQYGLPSSTTSCVSSTMVIIIALLQSVALGVFIFIRSKSDKAKFY